MGISALVVDDSVLYRKTISRKLQGMPEIGEVRQASNGKEALRLFKEKPADLVTLDIEMPLMTGLEALPQILEHCPQTKVLMISSLTVRGAEQTMKALSLGATDYVTKEQAFGLTTTQADALEENLEGKLKGLLQGIVGIAKGSEIVKENSGHGGVGSLSSRSDPKNLTLSERNLSKVPVSLMLIGSSTGGPQTLQEVLGNMKKRRNYATVIVQHMPPLFTAQLAANLKRVTGHKCFEASEGVELGPGDIAIAKGGQHLKLEKNGKNWICHLDDGEPINSCRPSVDVTFFSVAEQLKTPEVVAMMLTGMGGDGAKGMMKLHQKRVPILNQEASSCVVYGMPKAVDDLGITDVRAKPIFIVNEAEKFMTRPEVMG